MRSLNNITVIIIVVYFILRTYGIVEFSLGAWIIPLFFICLNAIHVILNQNLKATAFLFKESKWIVLSFVVLLISIIFNHGNFKLYNTFTYLLSSVPFYILGYSYGIKGNITFVRKITIYYLVFLFLYILPKIYVVLSARSFDSALFNSLFVMDEKDKGYILFLPFLAFITLYGFQFLYKSKSKKLRLIGLLILFSNSIGLFIASKAGAISLILFSIIIYYLNSTKKILKKIVSSAFVGTILFLLVFIISSGLFGELGSLKAKSSAFVSILDGGFVLNDQVLDRLTSHRWTADIYSFQQFLKKPIFGNGAYLESIEGMLGDVGSYTTASGGHSFLFDTLAYYGIFGLPIILILYKFAKDGFRYYRLVEKVENESKNVLLYASLMSSLFIMNVLNTGFLFSPFDNFLFLLAGYYLGKYFLWIKNAKKIKKQTKIIPQGL